MKILGADLKSDHAIITILEGDKNSFNLVDCKTSKITLEDSSSVKDVKSFKEKFEKILKDFDINKIVIKKRLERGMYAGAAGSFKLEGIIQLNDKCAVDFLGPQKIKAARKKSPVEIPKGVKEYQEAAFETAYAYLKNQ